MESKKHLKFINSARREVASDTTLSICPSALSDRVPDCIRLLWCELFFNFGRNSSTFYDLFSAFRKISTHPSVTTITDVLSNGVLLRHLTECSRTLDTVSISQFLNHLPTVKRMPACCVTRPDSLLTLLCSCTNFVLHFSNVLDFLLCFCVLETRLHG